MRQSLISLCLALVLIVSALLPCLTGCGPSDDTEESSPSQQTEVVINELCAKNRGSNLAPDGKTYDWIELYNPSKDSQDLSNWYLTDDISDANKYRFPKGTVLEPGSYLLLWAVGKNDYSKGLFGGYAMPFKLSEDGDTVTLLNPKKEQVFSLDYPALNHKTDEITYGRIGPNEWGECDPTPGQDNSNHIRVLAMSTMTFSHESGFYDDAFELTIDVPQGHTVYYTVDCSDPKTSNTAKILTQDAAIRVYDKSSEEDTFSSIKVTDGDMFVPTEPVDKCFIVRAFVIDGNKKTSRTVTKTYFIDFGNKDGYTNIPVISLTADPEALYGEENGLFISDNWSYNASVNRQEIEADFTFIDEKGNFSFRQNVGMRIRGTSTRGIHQKSLNLFARSRYDGNSAFIDPLFEGVTRTESVVLRSDNMHYMNVGQGFLQDLAAGREISAQKNYPVAVFLDGEYYGIYNLYERFSEDYVESHYGIDDDNVWIVKKGGAQYSIEGNCQEAMDAYTQVMHYICNVETYNNLARDEDWEQLCQWVDMQSLIDLIAVQLYIGNEDFSMAQNITAWRSIETDAENPYADGKWRFVIYDLDFTLECSAAGKTYSYDYDPFTQSQPWAGNGFMGWAYNHKNYWPFSTNLLANSTFKEMFVTTFIEVARIDFAYKKAQDAMDTLMEALTPNMLNYVSRYHRWYDQHPERMEGEFEDKMEPQYTYLERRADYVIGYMLDAFGLTESAATLTVGIDGVSKATLSFNGWSMSFKKTKEKIPYVQGYALTLSASEAPEGYVFDGWVISGCRFTEGDAMSETVTVVLKEGTASITATYVKQGE